MEKNVSKKINSMGLFILNILLSLSVTNITDIKKAYKKVTK